MFRLEGRKFLITGASGGIGQAIIKIMHEAGATLCISGTKREILEKIVMQYKNNIDMLLCNLCNLEEVTQLISKASHLMNGFDGLVCNAGIVQDSSIFRMNDDIWQKVIDVNLTATFKLNKEASKILIKNNWGRIINISSIIALTGNAGQANYAASKAGIIAMSKSIAREVASRNITVNCIAPGFIDTNIIQMLSIEHKKKILDNIPMKRMGTGEEVAYGVLFLASDEAKYITGFVLNINGGLFM
ncbi:3-oxoacyl-ACP reductase FabG [Wolbachia endosymbiont of Howardula sp.]|uniref:3-oxoacyl-ACP reductase FabG n=1 Tax=Wolbachia endosymbiont of Howardula sp. TaxID=2916816 RepID=UPI00217D80D3|nr:3-oxoacyl-ACP reductase FabG [Wolbachia endosymbiont of Howardula sp.]UWI83143.1 3-oxoacyl-ACP reductase FabG [Wolbachia endosymbiont of Howardula sp.]